MRTAQASLLTVCALLAYTSAVIAAACRTAACGTEIAAPLLTLTQNRVDTSEGARIWPHCAFCHTPDGLGFVRFDAPKIAGQEAWYAERQLRNFLAGRRGNHPEDIPGRQMAFNAGPLYTDPLIESMAAFLEALPVSPAKLQYLQAGRPGAGATLQVGFTIRRHDCRLASFRGEGQATLRNLCRLPRREGGGQSRPEFPETRQQAGLVPDPGAQILQIWRQGHPPR